LMASDSIREDVGSPAEIARIREALAPVLGMTYSQIPYWREECSLTFLTCAGMKLNQAITVWAGGNPRSATELTLSVDEAIDFARLPGDLHELAPHLLAVDAMYSGELTVFQNLLPHEILVAERLDWWFKTPALSRALERLREATLVLVAAPRGLEWGTGALGRS
jgi:hypothetical protein